MAVAGAAEPEGLAHDSLSFGGDGARPAVGQPIEAGQLAIGIVVQTSIEAWLYFLASITLRECRHVVMASQLMILSRHNVQNANKAGKES